MYIKADLHVHTERSFDSRTTLAEAVEAAKKAGLDFLAVTDHDVPPPEEVFSHPEREGVLLIPGVEYSTDKGHLLGLFLQTPCPNCQGKHIPWEQAAEHIHCCGGLAVLAHPFQSTAQTVEERFRALKEMEPLLDGLEIQNRRATKKRKNANHLAERAAEQSRRPWVLTAGSDAHLPEEIGTCTLSVECTEKSQHSLREALLAQTPASYACAPCRNRYIAESQKIKLQKNHGSPYAWARWFAFRALCAYRDYTQKKG